MHRSTPSDRRAFGRRQSFIHALARIHGRAAEPCIVKNFSDGGALIEFPIEFAQPPQKLRLCIDALGIDAECEVRRHEGKLIGVRFLDPAVAKRFEEPTKALPEVIKASPVAPELAAKPVAKIVLQPIGSGARMLVVSGADLRRRILGEAA